MKQGIHPNYVECNVTCGCGNKFVTRSVKPQIHVEVCGACHPFYTGKQRFVDTAGRVEKFQRRHKWDDTAQTKAMAVKETKLVPIMVKTAMALPKVHKKSKEAAEAEAEFVAKETARRGNRDRGGPGGGGAGGGRGGPGAGGARGGPRGAGAGAPSGGPSPEALAAHAAGVAARAAAKASTPAAPAAPKAEDEAPKA